MESQYKVGGNGGVESGDQKEVQIVNKRKFSGCDVVLRFLAFALCLTAAVVFGVNKETTTTPVQLLPTLPPINVSVTAKWHYSSAFVFFVVANAIACGYAGISILLKLANGNGKIGISMMIILLDLVMVALVFSSVGAAIAVGVLGYEGNSHLRWKKVCNVFDKFCHQGAAAMGLSGSAGVVFLLLVALAAVNLHKKH